MTETTQATLTVDELARHTGMTVRNIRAHQSRGLLPPPQVRGRTGYYGPEHVTRIELIRELQGEGFNLEAIRRLLDSANGSGRELLRFTRAVRAPFEDETPEIVRADQLADAWGPDTDPALLERAVELGILRPLGDGLYEQSSPRLARAGAELAALGVSPRTALELVAKMRRHAEGVARAYVRLYLEEVWQPFAQAGHPEEDWPKVRDALERLRPLASEALLAIFQLVMTEATERAFGRQLEQMQAQAGGGRKSRRRRRSSARTT